MASLANWIEAARPRTLPLAVASILLGSLLAAAHGLFDASVFLLGLTTTLFLQILSNFANDYGDFLTGVDDHERAGPARAVQKGAITMTDMRTAMFIISLLALLSGIALVIDALSTERALPVIGFLALGLLAITAAVKYTVGKKPYGYLGAGELFVFLFFGWVGVLGIYFLHTVEWRPSVLFPATAFGLIAAAVLNLNNLRDRLQDAKKGKHTLAVRLGKKGGVALQYAFLLGAILLSLLHSFFYFQTPWQLLYLLSFPLFAIDLVQVLRTTDHEQLDPELKRVSIGALIYAVGFGGGLLV